MVGMSILDMMLRSGLRNRASCIGMFLGMNVPRNDLWAESLHTGSFLRIRLLTKSWQNLKTPYEVVQWNLPKLGHIVVFCSQAYNHKRAESRNKNFYSQVLMSMHVAYYRENAYRVLLHRTNNITDSEDMKIVKAPLTAQNRNWGNSANEFDHRDRTVISKRRTQNKYALADISVHKTNLPVLSSARMIPLLKRGLIWKGWRTILTYKKAGGDRRECLPKGSNKKWHMQRRRWASTATYRIQSTMW